MKTRQIVEHAGILTRTCTLIKSACPHHSILGLFDVDYDDTGDETGIYEHVTCV